MSNTVESGKKRIPVKEGLFHIPESAEDKPYLIGSKCRMCGCVIWPKRHACPACQKYDVMDDVPLSTRGKLHSFSVLYQAPEGFKFEIPYIQAVVRLPEGISLFTLVTGVPAKSDALKIGQEMEMIVDKIREDEEGNEIVSWKFQPV